MEYSIGCPNRFSLAINPNPSGGPLVHVDGNLDGSCFYLAKYGKGRWSFKRKVGGFEFESFLVHDGAIVAEGHSVTSYDIDRYAYRSNGIWHIVHKGYAIASGRSVKSYDLDRWEFSEMAAGQEIFHLYHNGKHICQGAETRSFAIDRYAFKGPGPSGFWTLVHGERVMIDGALDVRSDGLEECMWLPKSGKDWVDYKKPEYPHMAAADLDGRPAVSFGDHVFAWRDLDMKWNLVNHGRRCACGTEIIQESEGDFLIFNTKNGMEMKSVFSIDTGFNKS
jgi:hypothetical protein